MSTYTLNGISYSANEAYLTGRNSEHDANHAKNGEQYTAEWAADAKDETGNDYTITWHFTQIKGSEEDADNLPWDDESCMSVDAL